MRWFIRPSRRERVVAAQETCDAAAPQADGSVCFDGMVLDGWGEAFGG